MLTILQPFLESRLSYHLSELDAVELEHGCLVVFQNRLKFGIVPYVRVGKTAGHTAEGIELLIGEDRILAAGKPSQIIYDILQMKQPIFPVLRRWYASDLSGFAVHVVHEQTRVMVSALDLRIDGEDGLHVILTLSFQE